MKKVVVLVGPTASGKTKNSILLAKEINGEVINGDSVQVYNELNIGSAKITKEEMEGIPHHLFNMLSAKETYSVYNFQQDARKLIEEIDQPIIVGGTGFYIKAALYDYEFNDENKAELLSFDELSNEELYERILEVDPLIKIDKNNRVRLVRAYNLALSGNLRSEKTSKNVPLYDVLTIYLDIDRQVLKTILIDRLDIMIENGFLDEVKMLRENDIHLNTIGYRELDLYLEGKYTMDEAKAEIIRTSVKLAKKQKTWFLNQMDAIPFDPLDENVSSKIIEKVKTFLNED
ncbi:MAG TPA: tRNA (adenosine(37)-N6)-dimethylallyltransferase MiaA [Haploplasma sp.]|nr:tRNA (adenosine(37)-N6)-dimethylallyltransferase MiaA [Haploplasma sp.]